MIKELYKYVSTSHALCTQWDAFVLRHEAWDESWLNYDYIGAPWWFNDEKNVGNGGFSLRSKKFLKECSLLNIRNYHPEDVILCRTYRSLLLDAGITFAPDVVGEKFSLEGNATHDPKWTDQFGFHDFNMTDIRSWIKNNKDKKL